MCKTVSKLLPLFLLALLWGLPLHADELTEEQEQQLGALWDTAYDKADQQDYQGALKATEKALEKLEQWRSDKIYHLDFISLQVELLQREEKFDAALGKQKELFSLTEDLFGDDAPETVEARVMRNDLEKIAALTPAQQKELSDGEAAYHGAVDEADLEKAIKLGEQMAAKEKKYLGEDCTWYTNSLFLLADNYIATGKHNQAEEKYQQILKIVGSLYGLRHPATATIIGDIAVLDSNQGDYRKAEPLFKKALSINEEAFGPDDITVAYSLEDLASLYRHQEYFAKAEPLYERALQIHEKVLGKDDPDVAMTLTMLGVVYAKQKKYAEAEAAHKRALAIARDALGPNHPDAIICLENFASLFRDMKQFDNAAASYRRVLLITEGVFGPNDIRVAKAANDLGETYLELGRYADADPLFKQALKINENVLDEDHPSIAINSNNLGEVYSKIGRYNEAESLYKRAIEINQKGTGGFPGRLGAIAKNLNNLGLLYLQRSRYAEAETQFKLALEFDKEAFGSDNEYISGILNNLGLVYQYQGRDTEAEEKYREAISRAKKSFGADHPNVATNIQNLANFLLERREYVEAELLYKRSLGINETILGPEHSHLSVTLSSLGMLYAKQEKYSEAEPLLKRAVEIADKADEYHWGMAHVLRSLGFVYLFQGKLHEAEQLFNRSLTKNEKILGSDHPYVAIDLENLSALHLAKGDYEKAIALLKRAIILDLRKIEINATVQSERQQLVAVEYLEGSAAALVGLSMQQRDNCRESYRIMLDIKGIVTRRQQLVRSFADRPELAPLFTRLQSIASRLSNIVSSNDIIDPASHEEQIGALAKQKEAIEQQISRRSKTFRELSNQVTIENLQDALPGSTVLLDFHVYMEASGFPISEIRFACFVIPVDGPIELVDLCDYEDFQRALATWKENLGRNVGPATELGKLIWEPLAEHVEDVKLVLYSPIAELGSVPFAALPGKEPGSYLLEEKQLVMIPQAKLLPALLEREQSSKPTVLAIGGVDYESVAGNETEEPVQLVDSRRAVRWNDEALFTPLPETESELEAVGKLYNQQFDLGKLQTLKDDRATEAAVKRLAPQYSHLHFATHGFFAPPEVKSALDNSDNQFQRQLSFDDQPRFTGFHPGLLSGLALAGANDPPKEGEDGIWTAEEVATMNLSKVDLAVLSACETGLGKVAGGEGLLGLQRAFQVSGAGTTVASLWQVDDAATRALMDEFYRNLWERKLPKIEALRQAQLKMLREYDPQKGTLRGVGGVRQLDGDAKPERLPPFYWAAWVLSGDWR